MLNFEEIASFVFTVKVKDAHNLTYLQSFDLTVLDKNDEPTNITLQGKHVAFVHENDQYKAIGTLDTTDEDFNQKFMYVAKFFSFFLSLCFIFILFYIFKMDNMKTKVNFL